MKVLGYFSKSIVLGVMAVSSVNAFAAGAVAYSCIGKNAVTGEAVVMELLFSDSAPGAGYTNESVTITKSGGIELKKAIVLQMYDANTKNECQKNSQGEINMSGDLNMEPTKQGDIADYTIAFKSLCGKDKSFDLKAYCLFQY
jgi:hypothetical protein